MTANRQTGIGAEEVQRISSNWSSGQAVNGAPRTRAQSPATLHVLGDQRVSFNLSSPKQAAIARVSIPAR